jgi:uncharacterized membrane protein HdeD (DUF308 family)
MLIEQSARRWWTLVVRGILVIAFGILTVALPAVAVTALVLLFGIYSLADGFASLSSALRQRIGGRWMQVLVGVLSVVAGLVALFWPGITAVALILVIAWWAILIGIVEIIAAIVYSRELTNEWAIVLSGLLWIAFGVIVILWPFSPSSAALS